MAAFRNWVKSAIENVVDPDKQAEVAELTQLLHEGIAKRKQSFVLAEVLKDRPYKQRHLEQAKTELYQRFLTRAWHDGAINVGERTTLTWAAKCLELSDDKVRAIDLEAARPRFAETFAGAIDDGQITATEVAALTEIAKAGGLSLKAFTRRFFRNEAEAFLRGVFAGAVAENHLPRHTLAQITGTAETLGLSREEVLQAVRPQAEQFIEHVLADAKEDGVLSAAEDTALQGWLEALDITGGMRHYVLAELSELRLLTAVRNGKLPLLVAPAGLSIRAGELVHFNGRATWAASKLLKDGISSVEHRGFLTITDSRLIFSSETRSEQFTFSRVVSSALSRGAIELEVRGKPAQRFFCDGNGRIPAAILSSALAMANQVLRNTDESRNARHIPRDVRLRVWQRYGGQCAECGAKDYLEFDHIIPVAKGGSNSDANVQLLCRRCNLKKSDAI